MKNLNLLLTITIVGLMVTINTFAETIVTDGLVSYWTFDQETIRGNSAEDVWGENDATTVGTPKKVDGYVRGGLELDGNGEYVILPNVGNFGSQLGPYTFEAWINTTYTNEWSAIYRVVLHGCFDWHGGNGILINAKFDVGLDEDPQTAQDWITIERFHIDDAACSQSTSGSVVPLSDGEWHQIVYTTRPITEEDDEDFIEDAGRGCYIDTVYIDGNVFYKTRTCHSRENIEAVVEPFFLGAVNNEGKASAFFNGIFDDVRIYDRALTEEEVFRNYKSGIGLAVEAAQKLPTVWGALKHRS